MTSAIGLDRHALRRVVAVANGKGGVGKTSVTTHLGGQTAAGGRKVLMADLDPQGNTEEDLGYDNQDQGASMVRAVMAGTPLHIIHGVRPNLDVIPGGAHLHELADHFHYKRTRRREGDESALLGLARVLSNVAGEYDLVLIDCPPANSDVLQDAALEAARYLLIPTHSDRSSRLGIVQMAQRFQHVRRFGNADLQLLGVLLFGVTSSATTVRKQARNWIGEALQSQAPVFDATIRHVEATAYEVREQGRLAHELSTGSSAGLARDYHRMAIEVFQRLVQLEQAAGVAA